MSNFLFGEAFCLMWYKCACGHAERIWNSRDGITPFALGCPSCGKPTLTHGAWTTDIRAPQHPLHIGQRFWRDGTPDEAAAIMNARLDSCIGTVYEVTPERRELILKEVRSGGTEFQAGWPFLDIHTTLRKVHEKA